MFGDTKVTDLQERTGAIAAIPIQQQVFHLQVSVCHPLNITITMLYKDCASAHTKRPVQPRNRENMKAYLCPCRTNKDKISASIQ
jgi:hypothetical protein